MTRPYVIESYTKTVCPACFAERPRRSDEPGTFIDGMLVSHEGAVWLRRFCPVHGETESLYEEDLAIWKSRFGWGVPTLSMVPDREGNIAGFSDGYRDGLPASHGQHTCILLLNVTEHCNYACPTCYANALSPGTKGPADELPSLDQVLHTLDTMLAREAGKLGVLMLSGGEPTVRRDIEALIDRALERNITRVMLNTNGRRIALDDKFLRFLHDRRDRVEVYLQFDGFRPQTHLALRGEDVSEEKQRALQRLNEAHVFTNLVMTVAKGINDDELGDVLALGMETPRCQGLAIQAMFGSGRTPIFDPLDRITPTGVIRRLEAQTHGQLTAQSFVPLPCSHQDCCDITFLVRGTDGQWKAIPDLLGRETMKDWLHLVSNTIAFESASEQVKQMVKSGVLARLFSGQPRESALATSWDLLKLCDCVPGLLDLLGGIADKVGKHRLESFAERTFRVTCKMFMDSHTLHEARIRQCCVHVGTFEEDPRRYSFCWRWLFEDATDFPSKPPRTNLVTIPTR